MSKEQKRNAVNQSIDKNLSIKIDQLQVAWNTGRLAAARDAVHDMRWMLNDIEDVLQSDALTNWEDRPTKKKKLAV